MKDLNKLHFTEYDERDLRILCDELDRLQKQCKDTLWKDMVSTVSGVINIEVRRTISEASASLGNSSNQLPINLTVGAIRLYILPGILP